MLTNTQVLRLLKVFANGLSANVKLSKAQLSEIVQSGEFITFLADSMPRKIQKGGSMVAKTKTEYFVDEKIDEFRKKLATKTMTMEGSRITLTNTVIKDIIEVIRSIKDSRDFKERNFWKDYESKKEDFVED